MIEEVNLTQIHCRHICKCNNENPSVQLIYANKKTPLISQNSFWILRHMQRKLQQEYW
jgi:hypothetical protein